jgi:hypothetical protein
VNATVRGGGITCRTGYQKCAKIALTGLFEKAFIYQPDNGLPYPIIGISGDFYRVNVGTDNSVELLTYPGVRMSATADRYWFCQGEQFLVIQDGINDPLVWDGTTLQHSAAMPKNNPADPTIPVATCMTYVGGRLWFANGREYIGSDLVSSTAGGSGTAAYNYRDSILRMTENAYLTMNGGFIVPTNSGNITALTFPANLHTNYGQGNLFIFTHDTIYNLNVPPDRTTWQTITELNTPLQSVVGIGSGTMADLSIVRKNDDIFYQCQDGVRSFKLADRDFSTWGNTPISNNETRVLAYNDRSMMPHASGIEFQNRMLQLALPIMTDRGVAFQAIMPLDLDPISTLQKRMEPAWEGAWEGLDFMQLLEAKFNGRQRAFAVTHSRLDGSIEVWELTDYARRDGDDNRITWIVETGSYHWNYPFGFKELAGLDLWFDKLFGTVDFEVYFRPDQYPCWILWNRWQECAARNECEDPDPPLPCDYPEQIYREQYRSMVNLPLPPGTCEATNGRPVNLAYSFQIKIVVKGWGRIRGIVPYSTPRLIGPFDNMRCAPLAPRAL